MYVLHVAVENAAMKQTQQKLEFLALGLRCNGLTVESLCLQGEPVETILGQAARLKADLITVGTQDRRGLPRVMLGSVAEGVLHRAGCPVLVVRREARLWLRKDVISGKGTAL